MLHRFFKRKKKGFKIFCVGLNKTGTTSLRIALEEHGFNVGSENEAHRFMEHYSKRDFSGLIRFCEKSDAFQDTPFSWWYTFIIMDQAFPGSKFILTERNTSEEWYDSLVRFHSNKFGNGSIPTAEDLQNAKRPHGRNPYMNFKLRFGVDDDNMYDKKKLISYYETHNKLVKDYFRFRPEDLLVLNLEEQNAYQRFCAFLNLPPLMDAFPKANVSSG